MSPPADLTGRRFGRLKGLRFSHKDEHNTRHWLFLCDCGNHVTTTVGNVVSGRTKSCGCLRTQQVRRLNAAGGNRGGVGRPRSK